MDRIVEKENRQMKEVLHRNISYDLLRIQAAILVVLLHVSAISWNMISPSKPQWMIINLYNSMTRGAVPIFFMLSGAFLLKKDIDIKDLYIKKIIPLSLVWLIWSFLYTLDTIGLNKIFTLNYIEILTSIVNSYYHLWFIPTLIGLYVLQPILRGIVVYRDGKFLKYLLYVFLIFGVFRTTILVFTQNLLLINLTNLIPMELMGYSCYMMIGYYFANINVNEYNPKIMLLIFFASSFLCALAGQIQSLHTGIACETLHSCFSITSFFEAISLFLLFKNVDWNVSIKSKRAIYTLSELTFGVYLIHPFIINHINVILNINLLVNTILAIPLYTIIIVIVSFLVTFIMNKIPLIKNIWKF